MILKTLIILKSLKYKAKLLRNTVAQTNPNQANGFIENATILVALKYVSGSRRSLETPLINCKVELKLRWTNHCVLSVLGAVNDSEDGANSNDIIFTVKYTKLHFPVVILSLRDNEKDQCVGINIGQKVRIKVPQMSTDIFSNQTLQELKDFCFCFLQIKIKL